MALNEYIPTDNHLGKVLCRVNFSRQLNNIYQHCQVVLDTKYFNRVYLKKKKKNETSMLYQHKILIQNSGIK